MSNVAQLYKIMLPSLSPSKSSLKKRSKEQNRKEKCKTAKSPKASKKASKSAKIKSKDGPHKDLSFKDLNKHFSSNLLTSQPDGDLEANGTQNSNRKTTAEFSIESTCFIGDFLHSRPDDDR